MRTQRSGLAAVAALAGAAGVAWARPGPDVTLQDIPDISTYGPVGGVHAYSIGSGTCNIGNQNLLWLSQGTPALAMNAYRLHDGRLTQIGLGFCKTACCAAAAPGCGTCNGAGGNVLGVGCKDTYFSGWNGIQSALAPRSAINGYSGAFTSFPASSGDAVFRRLQVNAADMNATTYSGALYFVEGVYVGSDDAANGNGLNNATYQRVTVNNGTMALTGTAQTTIPAIRAWRDHGLGANQPDTSVTVASVDVPGEGRFWYAYKVRSNGNGTWRYTYAVYNLNSDRSGGSLSVPIPDMPTAGGVRVTNVGFSAPAYHSGEPYSNTAWTGQRVTGAVRWDSPQTFAQNPNTNALRWGTMHTYWFDATTPPVAATATLGLFKPFTPAAVTFPVLGPACYADCDGSAALNVNDFICFQSRFGAAHVGYGDCDQSGGVLNVNDFICFQQAFAAGCP